MLQVPCKINFSKIHGLGLFAVKPILKGVIIWKFDGRIDQIIKFDDALALDPERQAILRQYAYCTHDLEWVLCGDTAIFMNHSDTPNTQAAYETSKYGEDIAARDIEAGEELTCNYNEWDLGGHFKLFENTRYTATPLIRVST